MVKYIRFAVPILYFLLIFIFAVYGEKIYMNANMNVNETTVKLTIIDGKEMIVIPKTSYTGKSVFIAIEKEGFMITHNVLIEVPVTISEITSESEYYMVKEGVKVGDRIIDNIKSSYKNGQKVIIN